MKNILKTKLMAISILILLPSFSQAGCFLGICGGPVIIPTPTVSELSAEASRLVTEAANVATLG